MNATPDAEMARTVGAAVRDELNPMFDDLRRFVDRRIAELSAEVSGAAQLVDYSEANIAGHISRMQEELGRMIALPSAATRNSGLDLESVVEATESAANRIMEAAESIGNWVQAGGDPAQLEAVQEQVNAIFEACSFQDLTGQRIRRAIDHLQQVDTMLQGLATDGVAATAEANAPAVAAEPMWTEVPTSGPDLAQDEIDKLLA